MSQDNNYKYSNLNKNAALFMLCSNTVAKDNSKCNENRKICESALVPQDLPINDDHFTIFINNINEYYSHRVNTICIYLNTCPNLVFDFVDIYPFNYFACGPIGQRKRKRDNTSLLDYLSDLSTDNFHVILVTACAQNIDCIETINRFKDNIPFRNDNNINHTAVELLKTKINAMNVIGSGPNKSKFIRYKNQKLFLNTIRGQYRYVVDSKQTHILYKDVVRKVYI